MSNHVVFVDFLGALCGAIAISFSIYWQFIVRKRVPAWLPIGHYAGGVSLILVHLRIYLGGSQLVLALRTISYLILFGWLIWVTIQQHDKYSIEFGESLPP